VASHYLVAESRVTAAAQKKLQMNLLTIINIKEKMELTIE
jgi:hypothetical protein